MTHTNDSDRATPFNLDRDTIEASAARTAYVLAWASAEEEAGRTHPGEDLDEIAPTGTPEPFEDWARDMVGAVLTTIEGTPAIGHPWGTADPEDLGRALALSCGGWTDGLGEIDLPRPDGLPSMGEDCRLWIDTGPEAVTVEALMHAAGRADDPEQACRAVVQAIEAGEDPEYVLEMADRVLCGFGVESLDTHRIEGAYVNMGDTYEATLIHDGERFTVSDLGTVVEAAKRAAGPRAVALAELLEIGCGEVEEAAYGDHTYEADGGDWLVLTDEEADESAKEAIGQIVWAFRPGFIAAYVPDGIGAGTIEAIQGDRCEDANAPILALIEAGSGFDDFAADVIASDGRGHFLASYDGEEQDAGGFVVFRTN